MVSVWTGCFVYAQDTQTQQFPEGELKNEYFNSQFVPFGWLNTSFQKGYHICRNYIRESESILFTVLFISDLYLRKCFQTIKKWLKNLRLGASFRRILLFGCLVSKLHFSFDWPEERWPGSWCWGKKLAASRGVSEFMSVCVWLLWPKTSILKLLLL